MPNKKQIVTSAGIDMSLHALARLYGPEVARATARGMEYNYWEEKPLLWSILPSSYPIV